MKKRVVLVFLQNAWSPLYAGRAWPRESWLRALASSRSGQRLRVLEQAAGAEVTFHYENTTPICGDGPDSVVAADLLHIKVTLANVKPSVVVCCGKQSEKAVREFAGTQVLVVPHPAHRVLTNELYAKAGRMVRRGISRDVALRQEKGRVRMVTL